MYTPYVGVQCKPHGDACLVCERVHRVGRTSTTEAGFVREHFGVNAPRLANQSHTPVEPTESQPTSNTTVPCSTRSTALSLFFCLSQNRVADRDSPCGCSIFVNRYSSASRAYDEVIPPPTLLSCSVRCGRCLLLPAADDQARRRGAGGGWRRRSAEGLVAGRLRDREAPRAGQVRQGVPRPGEDLGICHGHQGTAVLPYMRVAMDIRNGLSALLWGVLGVLEVLPRIFRLRLSEIPARWSGSHDACPHRYFHAGTLSCELSFLRVPEQR